MRAHATLLGAYRSLIAFVGFPVVLLGGTYTYFQVTNLLRRPDVALMFVHPKSVAVSVANISQSVVQQPKYHVALFNLDSPSGRRKDPLPVPVSTGDYIRVGERWGPNSMVSIPAVQSRLGHGNRLLGWAWVTCPTCTKRFYWVYIAHGAGGWYAEMEPDRYPTMAAIVSLLDRPEAAKAAWEQAVDEERRVPIE